MDIEEMLRNRITKSATKIEVVAPKDVEYFFQNHTDKQNFVNSRLIQMKNSFLDLLNIDHFEPINHQSTKPFYTFGMISSPTGDRIESVCYLFNTTDNSNIPVKLDLSAVDTYSIFNGQIVALKGINTRGDMFQAHNIYTANILNVNQKTKSCARIVVSNGPFTLNTLERVFRNEADVYILLGPFYEVNKNPEFGKISDFTEKLQNFESKKGNIQIILVPSIEDDYSVRMFPQPAIKILNSNIKSLPNPGCFYLNNHLIFVCNFDNFTSLCYEEIFKEPSEPNNEIKKMQNKDKLGRMCEHLVFQKCFIPVLSLNSDVAYGKWLEMDYVPDLYIISSKMKCFDRKVGPITVLNVGGSHKETFKIECGSSNYKIEKL